MEVSGFSPRQILLSSLASQTLGLGSAGDINILTDTLTASNGGAIASITLGQENTGSAGQVNVNAAESIQLIGIAPGVSSASQITAGTGSAGNAGQVTINTQNLVLRDGGLVDASTRATGNAGTVKINATDSIEIRDTEPDSPNYSGILAAAEFLDPALQELFQLPPVPEGNAGNIQITTSQLNIANGGEINTNTAGVGDSGNISIDADFIMLDNLATISSETGREIQAMFTGDELVSSENAENIRRGEINISTKTLSIENAASIATNTFTSSDGGNININATDNIQLQRFRVSTDNFNALSFISTSSFGSGNAGDLNLSTGRLTILDGSRVGAGTFGTGLGGDVTVETELVEVIGSEPTQSVGSLLGASSLGSGNAGNLTIDTSKLVVRNGGRVDSSAAANGSAGNVNIEATESVEISGVIPSTLEPSLISSGVNIEDEMAQQIFQLPNIPGGNAGNVSIVTKTLNITDQANVSVVNDGSGDAGTLQIMANSVLLNNQGLLSAATQTGVGGNVALEADRIVLQDNSATTATAGGTGVGGNIVIDSNSIAILENSDVIANAFMGMGGSILINTQGFLLCGECRTTASSMLGIDGQVNIETLQPNTQLEIVDIPLKPTQAKEGIAIACQAKEQNSSSKLTISGRGGLPPRPQDQLLGESIIGLSNFSNSNQSKSSNSTTKKSLLPSPAHSWYRDAQGKVILSASSPGTANNNKYFNNSNCHVN